MRFIFIGFVLGSVWFWHPTAPNEQLTDLDKAGLERVLEGIK